MVSRDAVTDPRLISRLESNAVDLSDPFVQAIRSAENSTDSQVSPAGAVGSMQTMPATLRDPGFGVAPAKDPNDPLERIRVGRDYALTMLKRYDGDTELAAIAYNAGPKVADQYRQDGKLPAETQAYVSRVKGFLGAPAADTSAGGAVTDPDLIARLDGAAADQEGGFGHEFKKSFMGTLTGSDPQNVAKTIEALGGAFDNREVEEWGRSNAVFGANQTQARVPSYTDIPGDSVGQTFANARDYIAGQMGQGAGSMLPLLGGEAAGGLTAKAVGKGAGRLVGFLATVPASYALNTGDLYTQLEQDLQAKLVSGEVSRKDIQEAAVVAGIPISALDVVSLGRLTAPFKGRMAAGIAKAFLSGAGIEGATEAIQQTMQEAVDGYLGGDATALEHFHNIVDAGLGGALTGGVVEGGAHVAGALTGGHTPAEVPPPAPQGGGQPVPTPGIDPNTGIATVAPPTFDEEGNVVQEPAPGEGPAAPQGPGGPGAAPGPTPFGPAPAPGAPAGGGLSPAGPLPAPGAGPAVPGPAGPAAPAAAAPGPAIEPTAGLPRSPPQPVPAPLPLESPPAGPVPTAVAAPAATQPAAPAGLVVPQPAPAVTAPPGATAPAGPIAAPANAQPAPPEVVQRLEPIVQPAPQAPVSEPGPAATVVPPVETPPSGPQTRPKAAEKFATYQQRDREEKAKAEALAAESDKPLVLQGIVSPDKGVLISPDIGEPGKWRVTTFDKYAFSGHFVEKTKADAVRAALREGYADTNRNLMRALSKTPTWAEGVERLAQIQKQSERPAQTPTPESDVGPAVKIKAKRRAGRPKRPLDIIEALAYEGGIQDEGGEVSGILGRRGGVLVPGAGNIIRATGRNLDRAREHMTDLGYLTPSNLPEDQGRTTIRQLLDAIASTDRARRGRSNQGRVFSTRSVEFLDKIEEQQAADQAGDANDRALDRAITEMQLPPLSAAVRARAIEYAGGGMDLESALESAIMREGDPSEQSAATTAGGEQAPGGQVAPEGDQRRGPEPGPAPAAEASRPRPGNAGEPAGEEGPIPGFEQPAGERAPAGPWNDDTANAQSALGSSPHPEAAARQYLLDGQKRDGKEHALFYDIATGKVAAAGTNAHGERVVFPPEVLKILADGESNLSGHHNHPRESPLSPPDIAMLGWPGLREVWAHGEKFSSTAKLTPEARAAMGRLGAQAARRLYAAIVAVRTAVYDPIQAAVLADTVSIDVAQRIIPHLTNIALHEAGIIEYRHNFQFEGQQEQVAIYQRALDAGLRQANLYSEQQLHIEGGFSNEGGVHRPTKPVRPGRALGDLFAVDEGRTGGPAAAGRADQGSRGNDRAQEGAGQLSLAGTEERPAEAAAQRRQQEKQLAEAGGRGKARPKTGQESAEETPLFGGPRQTSLIKESRRRFADLKHDEVPPEQIAKRFGKNRAAIVKEMGEILERIGPKGVNAYAIVGGLTHNETPNTEGTYDVVNGIIEVALEGPTPIRILRHEILHALRHGGFFTDVEWSALQARALNEWLAKYDIKRRYAHLDGEAQLEEAIADAFGDYRRGARVDPPGIRRVWDRIVAFLKGVAGILDKHGITEEVFAAIEAGTVRDRSARVKDLAQGLHLSIKEARSRLQQAPKKDLSQEMTEEQLQALGRMGGKIGEPPQPGLGKRLLAELDNRLADRFKQAAIDRVHGIAMNEKAANDGRLREGAQSATKLAHLKAAIGDIVHAALTIGVPKWDQGTISYDSSVMPPMQILERAGDRAMEFQKLLAAGSAEDRDKINRDRIRKKAKERGWDQSKLDEALQDYEENGRLFKDDEIAAANKLMEVYPDFRDLRDKWNEYNKKLLDFYEQSGMIDENSRRLFETLHRNYVPFNRVMEDPSKHSGPPARMGFQGQHPNFWRQKGSLKNVKDLYQNAEANIARGIEAAINTVVMLRAEQDNAANGFQFFKPVSAGVAKTLVSNRTMLADLKRQGLEITAEDMEESGVDMDAVRTLWSLGAKPKGEVISWLRNGKVRYATDVDPLFYRAATQINAQQNATLRRILAPGRAAKHLLTAAVGLDPSYQLANWLRDAIHIWQVSDNGKLPFGVSIRGTVARLMGDPQFQEFLSAGGGMSAMFETAGGLGRLGHLRSRARALTGQDQAGPLTKIVRTAEDAVGMLQHFESTFEYGSRFGIYKKLVKEGKSRAEAAWQARDAATDFARRGDSPVLNAFIDVLPFFNAGIQGLYRTYIGAGSPGGLVTKGGRAARGRGGLQDSFAAAGKFAMKGMILSALSLAMFMRWKDDDRYKELADYQKDMYWHWWIGDTHYKFPKPFETGTLFGTIPERTAQLAIDHNGSKFAERLLWNIQNQFRLDLTPQIVRPVQGVAYNWDQFRDRQIVPSWLEEGRLPAEQYDATTPLSAIAMGRTIGYSPKKVEYLIDGYLGALGSYIMSAVDFGMRTLGDYPPAPTPRWTDFPLVSRVVGEAIPSSTQYTDNFYAMRDDIERTYGSIQAVMATGEAEYATKLMQENAPKMALRGAVNDLNRQLQRINQTLRAVKMLKGEGAAFSDQKRVLLDQLTLARNNITKASASLYDFYQKAQ